MSDKDVLGLWVIFQNSEIFVQSETNYLLAEIDQSPHKNVKIRHFQAHLLVKLTLTFLKQVQMSIWMI